MSEAWIFGYGSLVFRPGFVYQAAQPAWLRGYRRRLWQGSPDHRGTPTRPGRVATLVEDSTSSTLGVAFLLAPAQLRSALVDLDVREQAGYERREVPLALAGGGEVTSLVYLATSENPSWLGPAPIEDLVRHVAAATGPSGANASYVLDLATALERLGLTHESGDEVLAVARALHDLGRA